MMIHDNMDNAITRSIMNLYPKDKPEGKIKRKSAKALERLQLRKHFRANRSGLEAIGLTSLKSWIKANKA